MSTHEHRWMHLRDINATVEVQVCTVCLTTRLVKQQEDA